MDIYDNENEGEGEDPIMNSVSEERLAEDVDLDSECDTGRDGSGGLMDRRPVAAREMAKKGL